MTGAATNDQTVTQGLDPCPLCQSFEVEFGGYGRGVYCIICKDCCIQTKFYPSRDAAATAWNTRTAHSGDLAPGLERAAQWHDARCKGPSVFEQELHEVSAKALRHLAANHTATDMQALDAAHSGEGRSNGVGEDGYLKIPTEAMPRGPRRDAVVAAAMKLAPYSADPAGTPTRDGLVFLNAAINETAAAHFAALSAPQGEVERRALPRLDEGLIIAAMRGHYGSKADSIDGLDLTVDDVNWTFRDGFTRMWAGVRKELKRRAALAQPKGGDR